MFQPRFPAVVAAGVAQRYSFAASASWRNLRRRTSSKQVRRHGLVRTQSPVRLTRLKAGPDETVRRDCLQIICAFLLLFAQQGALMHAVWHAHDRTGKDVRAAVNAESRHGQNENSTQAQLCRFHLAFGNVLGAAGGKEVRFAVPLPQVERASEPERCCHHVASLPPQSRGPPVLS